LRITDNILPTMSEPVPDSIIPVSDPKRALKQYGTGIEDAIRGVLESGWFVGGNEIPSFESEFAAFLGARFAIGVASGTDALELALRACGINPGDRVATVSHTAVATVAAIERAGAIPVFVDIRPDSYTMDTRDLERVLEWAVHQEPGGHIKAILPVHLYGHPADMERIMCLAEEFHAVVVEDCAQAHGAMAGGRKCGTWGTMGAFSFYPTKNLGALGDAGAIVTNNSSLAEKARLLREYGWKRRYISEVPGMSSRLDAIQAAILRLKLRHLDADNARRKVIARHYSDALRSTPLVLPDAAPGMDHVYHHYVVRTAKRDSLRNYLTRKGIGTAVLYPQPVHLQPAYKNRFPVPEEMLHHTREACEQILSIPIFPELSDRELEQVETAILTWHPTSP
jgi:dTDP-4-amino-4,6-dideoxygalactose transaminase